MKPSEMLMAGAERIAEFGWIRYSFGSAEEGFCIVGSIPFPKEEHDVNAKKIAISFLKQSCTQALVSSWNDRICESKDEAILKLIEAAEFAESKGE